MNCPCKVRSEVLMTLSAKSPHWNVMTFNTPARLQDIRHKTVGLNYQ